MLVNLHDSSLVAATVAVIRCWQQVSRHIMNPEARELTRKNRDHVTILAPIVSFHHQLMSPRNKGQPIVVIECLGNILPKRVPSTPRTYPPSTSIIRITPQQIAHGAFMRDLLDPIKCPDVVQGIYARRKPSVEAEDLVVDQGGEGQVVEQICKVFPDIGVAVFSEALVVEAVDLGDLARFVVTTQDGDALRVADFEGNKQSHGLDGIVASINVVTCETLYQSLSCIRQKGAVHYP